ncbi:MAG: phosphatidylserine decarboxylase family protein [Desulfococcaceae bacterium]
MDRFYRPDPPAQAAFPIAKAGYPLIFGAAFVTAVFALLGLTGAALSCLVITVCICGFFRDPDRIIPNKENAVVSPADGKVVFADRIETNPYIDGPCLKISVFMSVLNVHVNRVPYSGKIKDILYHPGKFFSANLDKASAENEHNAVVLTAENGKEICFVQIAGLIARRILCQIQEGDTVVRGQKFGIICFGSRLDVYLPDDVNLNVRIGDKVSAGSSVLAFFNAQNP